MEKLGTDYQSNEVTGSENGFLLLNSDGKIEKYINNVGVNTVSTRGLGVSPGWGSNITNFTETFLNPTYVDSTRNTGLYSTSAQYTRYNDNGTWKSSTADFVERWDIGSYLYIDETDNSWLTQPVTLGSGSIKPVAIEQDDYNIKRHQQGGFTQYALRGEAFHSDTGSSAPSITFANYILWKSKAKNNNDWSSYFDNARCKASGRSDARISDGVPLFKASANGEVQFQLKFTGLNASTAANFVIRNSPFSNGNYEDVCDLKWCEL